MKRIVTALIIAAMAISATMTVFAAPTAKKADRTKAVIVQNVAGTVSSYSTGQTFFSPATGAAIR